MSEHPPRPPAQPPPSALIWLPGLLVAAGAAAATAHGLYATAVAARVPTGLAWLYPLITDGLALVAYAATTRLTGTAARYAWTVVVLAAGLSGLAQAAYLAGGPSNEIAPALRFGIGAWPAIAAAVVAHLLYLLATDEPSDPRDEVPNGVGVQSGAAFNAGPVPSRGVQSVPFNSPAVQPPGGPTSVHSEPGAGAGFEDPPAPFGLPPDGPSASAPSRPVSSPARDRAEAAATRHAHRHGAWPTVTELEAAAEVSRGTAARALKALRAHPMPLHLITDPDPHPDQDTQP